MSTTEIGRSTQGHQRRAVRPTPARRRRRSGFLAGAVVAVAAAGAAGLVAVVDGTGGTGGTGGPAIPPSAEEIVAQDFLTAYTTSDAEQVALHLADDATMPEGWARDLRRNEVWRTSFLVEPCETLSTSVAGTNISCAFSHHALGSAELGMPPFDLNVFTLRVDEGKVESFHATYNSDSNGLADQLDSVGAWVRTHHPGDWGFMASEDVADADLARWVQLWDERLTAYLVATTGDGA